MRKKSWIVVLCLLMSGMMLVPTGAGSDYFTNWQEGDEFEITGHYFSEEYWTKDQVTNTTDNGDLVSFTMSYVNKNNVQAFMVALHHVENSENGTGVLPYQMFGMHYFTPEGREVFMSALLAFLFAYNDTNGNGVPNTKDGEEFFYIIPFGAAEALDDANIIDGSTYVPETEVIEAHKLGEGHYQFGMRYKNLYAFVSQNPLLSLMIKTGWVAKFSELAITYDIKFLDDGTVVTETYYTIGQVTDLWAFIGGIPISIDPQGMADTMGVGAAHYVNIFTSKYQIQNETGNAINTNIQDPVEGKIVVGVGDNNEWAFSIGFRGDYDLLDEGTDPYTAMETDQAAYNMILEPPRLLDPSSLLVAWQLGFSAGVFSTFAYGLSDNIQANYDSPMDLTKKSLNPLNQNGFGSKALWYAVMFPSWDGYRVEHDPVYTAYTSSVGAVDTPQESVPGFEPVLLIGALVILAIVDRRRRYA